MVGDEFFKNNGKRDQYAKMVDAYKKANTAWNKKHPKIKGRVSVLSYGELIEKPFPPSRVAYDENGVSLHVYGKYNTYDISWEYIKNAADVLGWVKCLCEKNWCDNNLVYDFINCCCHHRKGIKVNDCFD